MSRRWHLPALSWLIGIAFACLAFTPGYIRGDGPFWQHPPDDAATGQIGWQYYARDAWRWPLFAVENYHQPEGSTVLLSDSLPLLALPMKAVYKASGWMPVYVGAWVAFCLVLQAVCASRLLAALDIRDPLTHVAGILLFCFMPVLLLRFGHSTLMGHFLILIALERYVVAKRRGLSARGWIALGALPVIAVHTHPYMAFLCSALVFATVADQWREGRITVGGAALRLGGSAAATALAALVGGLFRGGDHPYRDYGVFSFNLSSPFVPLETSLAGRWLGTRQPTLPGIFQSDGMSYLGVGILVLCLFAIPALRHWRVNLRRHGVLLATLVVLMILAVSNRVGLGSIEVVNVPLPDRMIEALSVFRAAGRFVWVPIYALLAALIVAVCSRHRNGRTAAFIVAAAALLQVIDTAPMLAYVRRSTETAMAPRIDGAQWTRLIEAHQRLFQFPSFDCGGLFGDGVPGSRTRELDIDLIAARNGTPTNSTYLARNIRDCERERAEAARDHGRSGVLYLYRTSEDIGALLTRRGVDMSRCGYLDDVAVCSRDVDVTTLR